MKIERGEVERLARWAEANRPLAVRSDIVAELCRTWLAVQDAPVAEVTREDWLENLESFGPDFIGQRVRLVRDGGGS